MQARSCCSQTRMNCPLSPAFLASRLAGKIRWGQIYKNFANYEILHQSKRVGSWVWRLSDKSSICFDMIHSSSKRGDMYHFPPPYACEFRLCPWKWQWPESPGTHTWLRTELFFPQNHCIFLPLESLTWSQYRTPSPWLHLGSGSFVHLENTHYGWAGPI